MYWSKRLSDGIIYLTKKFYAANAANCPWLSGSGGFISYGVPVPDGYPVNGYGLKPSIFVS